MPVLTKQPTCHYDAEHGWVTPEHRAACDQHDCPGCRPCSESHCDLLGRCAEHVDQDAGIFTCPRCIGRVKRDVRRIVERYAELPDEVEVKGVDSEALNLHGPAASAEQLEARRRWDLERGWCDFPRTLADDDPHHPYAVLGRWDMKIRDSYGPPTDLFVTVSTAADYLTGKVLEVFAHTAEFEDFARDVTRCLAHLETVLSDSREPEKGAPCPTCRDENPGEKGRRLVKHYAVHPGLPAGMACGSALGPRTEQNRRGCGICGGYEDTWHCPTNPAHWWSHIDYRARVDGDYLEHATVLTAGQMHEAHGIKPATLRKWAEREPRLRKGRNPQGQQTYDVERARAMMGDASDVSARGA